MSKLFSELTLRELRIRNRAWVSPMCQYSSVDGMPSDWHLVHLGSRAVGGAGLVMAEASAVSPEGRISPQDMGIWSARHAEAFKPITRFIRQAGAAPAIQLAHAGRKASTDQPWKGGRPLGPAEGGWEPIGPSAVPYSASYATPREMSAGSEGDIERVVRQFADAARWSLEGGFEVAEVHMAHGYLLHEFLSSKSNHRTDQFGGSLENRMRFPLRVAEAVRAVWPARWPVLVRISATEWADDGWDLEQSIRLSVELKKLGIDLIDCSSGGNVAGVKIPLKPGYQVPFAEAIRREAGIPTAAVGLITEARQAEAILAEGQADAIMIARALLNDPYWALRAAEELGAPSAWPEQYARSRPAATATATATAAATTVAAVAAVAESAARTPETEDD